MKVVVTLERCLKMGNYHLNQTQMKVKMSAKVTHACISMYMYVTYMYICSQQALRGTLAK